MTDAYRLSIKPSARKRSRAVGEWVNREGPRRSFASKELAREWARECAGPGTHLWVQDAAPRDDRPVDGYLVGGARRGGDEDPRGEQAALDDTQRPAVQPD